jgi:hypothetical protein
MRGVVMIAMVLGACSADTCPSGLVDVGQGVCAVPNKAPVTAGRPAVVGGSAGSRPSGILLPETGGQGGSGGTVATSSGTGAGGVGGMRAPVQSHGGSPAEVVLVPRGGAGGEQAGAGGVVASIPEPRCGDDIRQAGETCDGDCPADCDDADPCTMDSQTGDASTCDLRCSHTVLETGAKCGLTDAEGIYPTCHAGICYDDRKIGLCGNGAIDPGETCDPKNADRPCPTECPPPDACHTVMLTGHVAACSARCLQAFARPGNVCPGGRCDAVGNCVKEQESRL